MKNIISVLCLLLAATGLRAADGSTIRISTDNIDLVLRVAPNNRLYQVYLGDKLCHEADLALLDWKMDTGTDGSSPMQGQEAYATSGTESFFEPALAITHADGNLSTYLYYQSHEQKSVNGGTETIIRLADDKYADEVTLHYVAYAQENVIKTWSEVRHQEKKPVTLWRYASGMFYFVADKYFLTNYHSDWAREGQPATQQLQFGKKVIDTKLGTRAAEQSEPFFELGIGAPARENEGTVMLGTIGWTGNFSCSI